MNRLVSTSFILSVSIFTVCPSPVDRGQVSVIGASEPVRARIGDTVVLQCHCSPSMDLTPLTVEWSRTELRPHPNDRLKRVPFVHVYTDLRDDDPDMKIPEFTNRTRLFLDRLSAGVASLQISNVALSDNGTYKCFIPKLRSVKNRGWALVTLLVEDFDATVTRVDSSDLDPQLNDSDPAEDSPTPTVRAVAVKSVSITLFCVLCSISLVLFIWRRKKESMPVMKDAPQTQTLKETLTESKVGAEAASIHVLLLPGDTQTPQVNNTDR